MKMVKEMNVTCREEWSDDYREIGRRAIGDFLRERINESVTDHLNRLPEGVSDRRNGSYSRHVLTEIGNIVLSVPRNKDIYLDDGYQNLCEAKQVGGPSCTGLLPARTLDKESGGKPLLPSWEKR